MDKQIYKFILKQAWLWLLITITASSLALFANTERAYAQASGGQCIRAAAGFTQPNICTAEDVRIGKYNVLQGPTSCSEGQDVTLLLQAEVVAGANERFDIGLYVAEDGGDAKTGVCYRDYLHPVSANNTNLNLTSGVGPFYNAEIGVNPTDSCGDIAQNQTALFNLQQITIKCQDADNNGFLDVNSCVTWDVNDKSACTNQQTTVPDQTSKCKCGMAGVGQIVVKKDTHLIVNKVTIPATDTTTPFTITASTSNGSITGSPIKSVKGGASATYTVTAGTYSVSEQVPAGWDQTGNSCQNVQVTTGGTGSCTITNTKRGHLIVDKVTNPATDTTTPFTIIASGTGTIQGGATRSITGGSAVDYEVTPGTYSVSENPVAGWDTINNCQNLQIAAGETKRCTITNTQRGRLIVNKVTAPVDAVTPFTITASPAISITGNPVQTIKGGSSVQYEVKPGVFSVTEQLPTGWDKTGDTCQNVQVAAGATASCTITNTKRGQITIEVQTTPNGSAQTFGFTPTGFGSGAFNLGDNDQQTFSNLLPGNTYSISQGTLPTGWVLTSAVCTDSVAGTSTPASINLAPGETVHCVFTYTQLGKIIIQKEADPTDPTAIFTFTFDTNTVFTLIHGQQKEFTQLPGRYAVEETNLPADWVFKEAQCTETTTNLPLSALNDIHLDAGETVTCTVKNQKKGNITIVKNTLGGDGKFGFDTGGSAAADFTIETTGNTGSNATHFAAGLPGAYGITEIVPAGWDLTGLTCDANAQIDLANQKAIVTLTPGIKVTCIYTNTQRGQIVVKKQTEGGDGLFRFTTNVGLGAFDIATVNQSGVFTLPDLKPGVYNVAETVPAGWRLISADCSGSGNAPARIELKPGETVVCTFVNAQNGSIKLEKKTVGADGKFDFTSQTLTPANFSVTTAGGSGSLTFPNLPSGVYDISETVPAGWKLTDAFCDDESNLAQIELAAGEHITCTITNTKQVNITIVKKTVGTTGTFTFTSGAISPSPFTITTGANNEGSQAFTNLTPDAKYDFTELTKAGWQLTNIQCTGGSNITIGADSVYDAGDTGVDITPAPGENIICTFTNDPLPTATVSKRANPATLPEPGGPVVFTVEIKNTTPEPLSLTDLQDTPFGSLTSVHGAITQTNCALTTIPANATYTCSFTANVIGEPDDYKDTVTATLKDDEGNTITPQAEAIVTITDAPPQGRVNKQPQPGNLPEPGGPVTFTITVANLSATEAFTIATLIDDPYGDVTQAVDPIIRTTCSTPQVVQPGKNYRCTFTVDMIGSAPGVYEDTITATIRDNDGNKIDLKRKATVTINDLPSSIMVTKTADPVSIPESGGVVNYTIVVKNTSAVDSVTIFTLVDDKFGDVTATCQIPKAGVTLAPGASFTCTFPHTFAATNSPSTHVNTAVATGTDDDGWDVSGEDSETVAITNVPPLINVTKTADRTSIPEPGGKVNFTVVVENISVIDTVTIEEVVDSLYGNIGGSCQPALSATLNPGEKLTCQFSRDITGPVGAIHHNVATARGKDNDGTPVEGSDEAEVHIIDVPSSIKVTKLSDPTSVVEPGGNVVFTVKIENTSLLDSVTISEINDNVYGNLVGFCKIGDTPISAQQLLAPGSVILCTFTKPVTGDAGFTHSNVVTVKGTDDDGRPVQDFDEERVDVTDAKPDITVTKTADPLVAPETGGDVTFTVVVVNNSIEEVTLTNLTDSAFGNLDKQGTCTVPQTLAAKGAYTCKFTKKLSGQANGVHTNVVTAVASDNEKNGSVATDDATVFFSDVKPVIEVVKTANPERVPATGGAVTFTVKVVNNSSEEATLESLVDSVFGNLKNKGTCKVPQTLAPNGGTYTCSFTETVSGAPDAPHSNTVIATVTDDDGNKCEHTDDAIVRFTGVNPNLYLSKAFSLLVDEFDRPQDKGQITPGDTLRYTVIIENLGDGAATGVVFEDIPDPNTKLVAGSVKTSKGTILTGNNDNDVKVVVSIGAIAPNRTEKIEVIFDVVIIKGTGATLLRNQGIISVIDPREPGGVSSTPSDDPTTPKVEDPTYTEVLLPPTALDEEEEPGGASNRHLYLPVMRK